MILKFGEPCGIKPAAKGPKVVFFIGPTGVGKTTTIAKIASKFSIEQKKKIAAAGLKWENWLVKDEDNISLALVNKQSGKIRVILT